MQPVMTGRNFPFFDEIDLAVANPDDRVLDDLLGRRHRQKRPAGNQDVGCFMMGIHIKSPLEIHGRLAQNTGKFHQKIAVEPVCGRDFKTGHPTVTRRGMNFLTPISGKHIDFPHHDPGLGGGTGRRKGLKIPRSLRLCGFDSRPRHQSNTNW
jgi:hypothetical protein